MGKNEYPDEFDPTKDDAFLKNLEKALEPEGYESEAIDIDTQELTSILTIGEDEDEKESEVGNEVEEALPVIDISDLYSDDMPLEKEVDDDVIESISNQLASQVGVEYRVQESLRKKKAKPAWLLPTVVASGIFLIGMVVLFASKPGRNFLLSHGIGKIFGDNTTYLPEQKKTLVKALLPFLPVFAGKDPEQDDTPAVPDISVSPQPTAAAQVTVTPPAEELVEDAVYHFLVLGMDDVAEGEETSSDLILFISVNVNSGEVRLTTILRDLFVSMPGVGEDKLCTAYARGGIGLVYDTLERSLGIRPDGYLLFSYDKFRSFVDQVGGVTISLTAKEADYLNKTNYISMPENRVMVNGENHLNGDQALGYCRIRHVGTAQNEYNDIGRTARCQRLIMALYEQNRTRSMVELYGILTECFRMVTTDITGEECSNYLNLFLNMPESTFSSYRIPAEGSYTTSIIRGKAALVADLAQNRAMWQEFLFPPKAQEEEEVEKQE